jgi:hypothetical protein
MFDREKFIAEKQAKATAEGLTVAVRSSFKGTVPRRSFTTYHSFSSEASRNEFIARAERNGYKVRIIKG